MDIIESIKGNLAFTISKIASQKLDAKKVGQDLDRELDKALGTRASEKIQRGPLTHILLDIIQGIWEEDPDALAYMLRAEADIIQKKRR